MDLLTLRQCLTSWMTETIVLPYCLCNVLFTSFLSIQSFHPVFSSLLDVCLSSKSSLRYCSSRRPLQKSLPSETTSDSFGYSATHFSGLIVFRLLPVAAGRFLCFPLGSWFVVIFHLCNKSDRRGASNLLNSDTTCAWTCPGSLLHLWNSRLHHSEFRHLCCCCLQILKPLMMPWQLIWQVR